MSRYDQESFGFVNTKLHHQKAKVKFILACNSILEYAQVISARVNDYRFLIKILAYRKRLIY